MRRHPLVLTFVLALATALPSVCSAVTPGQIDEFDLAPSSTYGWTNGAFGSGIENVATGGPDVQNPNDNFLRISSGSYGGQQRLNTFADTHWQGNFSGVAGIRVDLKNFDSSPNPVTQPVRFAIREENGPSSTAGYATNAYMLAPGAWTTVFFPFTAATMTGFNEPQPLQTDLANVADFRFLISELPAGNGDVRSAQIGLDNITAVPKGDWNQDGALTAADIPAMLRGLTDLEAYKEEKMLDPVGLLAVGDINWDGQVTNFDVQPLLNLLANNGQGSIAAVPEPATLVLAALAVPALVWRVRRFGTTR